MNKQIVWGIIISILMTVLCVIIDKPIISCLFMLFVVTFFIFACYNVLFDVYKLLKERK